MRARSRAPSSLTRARARGISHAHAAAGSNLAAHTGSNLSRARDANDGGDDGGGEGLNKCTRHPARRARRADRGVTRARRTNARPVGTIEFTLVASHLGINRVRDAIRDAIRARHGGAHESQRGVSAASRRVGARTRADNARAREPPQRPSFG
jgi:hypothetical protein